MAIISIIIVESSEQLVSGIPRSITISTNIPSSIFYTLDGTDPTLLSSTYVDVLYLPTNYPVLTLKIYATNGSDSSPIITEIYQTDISNARLLRAGITDQPETGNQSLYPFGTNGNDDNGSFTDPGSSGVVTNSPGATQVSGGFDGDGYETAFINEYYSEDDHNIRYTTTDSAGRTGPGIGDLPSKVKIIQPTPPPFESYKNSNTFDPRAFVIFQNFAEQNSDESNVVINREFFTLEDPGREKSGAVFYNTGSESNRPSGTFLRSHYNPRDRTITYYYVDTITQRWIISKSPYIPGNFAGDLSTIISNKKEAGSKYVYEWIPYQRRHLF